MGKIKDTDLLLINRDGKDYNSPVQELSIPKKTSELDNDSNFITLADVPPAPDGGIPEAPTDGKQYARKSSAWAVVEIPEPDLEGSLTFRGTVANEAALPADAVLADLYYNEEDQHLYAKGESEWHKLSTIDDVDLDGFATEDWVEAKGYITAAEVPDDAAPINEVLAEGNTADPAQSLHFSISEGDIPPITTVDTIDFDGGAGLRLGGLVSYYHINQPFTVDTDSGDVSEFEYATKQMTVVEDAYYTTNDEGDVFNRVGLNGYKFRSSGTHTEINKRGIQVWVKDEDDEDNFIFRVDVEAYDGRSSIKAGEFIGDGSKLTNLPAAAVGISEVLAEGNTAEALQSMRFRLGAESVPDPDNLNPDPILLEDGIGSAHRALASSWTAHVQGTGGLHSDANANYFVNYILDEDGDPQALAKVDANYGFSYYQSGNITGSSSIGVDFGKDGINVSGNFKVDHEGSVEAKEFIGDGSKLTNLPAAPTVDQLPVLPD